MLYSDRQPLVSVCMPAYNSARYIAQTIESVLDQTYKNVELIITNDGSTDETGAILDRYKDLPNVRILNSNRGGPSAANNLAYKHSKGELIKFFDSDDVLNNQHIAAQVAKLLANPGCISVGKIRRFYNDDLSDALYEPLDTWQDLLPMEWLLIDNGKGLGMMQPGMFLIPRPILEESGLWNEDLSLINDFEFFPRVLLKANKLLFTDDASVYYRSGITGSVSSTFSRRRHLSAFTALQLTTSLLLQQEDSDRVRSVLFYFWDMWKYAFYLDDMELYRKTLYHMKRLGHYSNRFDRKVSPMVKLIGWKNEKRIKRLINRP